MVVYLSTIVGIAFEFNNIVYAKDIEWWSNRKFDGVVRQETDYSCGAASIAYLLNDKDPLLEVSEDNILEKLSFSPEGGYSLLDLSAVSKIFGHHMRAVRISKSDLQRVPTPFIAPLTFLGREHFTVVTRIEGRWVWVADPSWGNEKIEVRSFLKMTRDKNNELGTDYFIAASIKL